MMNNNKPTAYDALSSLARGAAWTMSENDYDTLEWWSEDIIKPSKEQIDAEIKRLTDLQEATLYQKQRASEYPDIKEYIDGVVKGDQEQIQNYIDQCLAVKAKYPKPGA